MPWCTWTDSGTVGLRWRRNPRSGDTGPPMYACPAWGCTMMPCSLPMSLSGMSAGRLKTMPIAPMSECSMRSTTLREKFGSSICGTAMRSPGARSSTLEAYDPGALKATGETPAALDNSSVSRTSAGERLHHQHAPLALFLLVLLGLGQGLLLLVDVGPLGGEVGVER